MGTVTTRVRRAEVGDQQALSNLMFFETHVHRHLDWWTPVEWLGNPLYWVLEDGGHPIAALACPQDPPGIAWVRLFVHSGQFSLEETWQTLWEVAETTLQETGGAQVALICMNEWLMPSLKRTGFQHTQDIVMLEWHGARVPDTGRQPEITIRPMEREQLPEVADLDTACFDPLWQNSLSAIERAFSQAAIATLATDAQGRGVGYQISTRNPFGAHLARLGVSPEARCQGVGSRLIAELIHELLRRGVDRLTVNTQGDNTSSLALYEKMGFVRTGEQYPVYTRNIPPNE
jgi:ribosomal protein S18 acetylase RimI-like enzyme